MIHPPFKFTQQSGLTHIQRRDINHSSNLLRDKGENWLVSTVGRLVRGRRAFTVITDTTTRIELEPARAAT